MHYVQTQQHCSHAFQAVHAWVGTACLLTIRCTNPAFNYDTSCWMAMQCTTSHEVCIFGSKNQRHEQKLLTQISIRHAVLGKIQIKESNTCPAGAPIQTNSSAPQTTHSVSTQISTLKLRKGGQPLSKGCHGDCCSHVQAVSCPASDVQHKSRDLLSAPRCHHLGHLDLQSSSEIYMRIYIEESMLE